MWLVFAGCGVLGMLGIALLLPDTKGEGGAGLGAACLGLAGAHAAAVTTGACTAVAGNAVGNLSESSQGPPPPCIAGPLPPAPALCTTATCCPPATPCAAVALLQASR